MSNIQTLYSTVPSHLKLYETPPYLVFPNGKVKVDTDLVLKLILIVCRVRIREFTCLLKFICSLKISTPGAFMVIHRHAYLVPCFL